MAQEHLKFDDYVAPDVDEDGYTESDATTSSANSTRTMRGVMKNSVLFTVEAYNLKWTNISAKDVAEIRKRVQGVSSFMFHHFDTLTGKWETSPFYAANITTGYYSLEEGREMCSELSFQVTGINPV